MKRDHLLVFLGLRAVIEANHHSQIVKVSPSFDMNKVGDLERKTLWKMGRRGDNAALCQIVHNAVQSNSNAMEIIGVARYVADQIDRVRIGDRFRHDGGTCASVERTCLCSELHQGRPCSHQANCRRCSGDVGAHLQYPLCAGRICCIIGEA
jgi:hypothetical protein